MADYSGVPEPEVVLDLDAALFLLCFSIAPPSSRTYGATAAIERMGSRWEWKMM
jgi:hypothetical protein